MDADPAPCRSLQQNAATASNALGSVPAWPIDLASVDLIQTSFAKCRARNFSGRPVNGAISLGSRVEELVQKMVFCWSELADLLPGLLLDVEAFRNGLDHDVCVFERIAQV